MRQLALLAPVLCVVVAAACDSDPATTSSPDAGPITLTDSGGNTPAVDSGAQVQGCPAPTKGPTAHGAGGYVAKDADEVWTADTSPHVIDSDVTIYKTVTIEPCAEVLIAPGKTVSVNGRILAEGKENQRIHIGSKQADLPFARIYFTGGQLNRFAYTTINGGGDRLNTLSYLAGTIDIQANIDQPTQEVLFVDHVLIENSKSNGLVMRDNAGFAAGSQDLVIKGSAEHPLSIYARSAGGIPTGVYTGNTKDQILFPTSARNETIDVTTTIRDRGVPYLAGHAGSAGDIRVDRPTVGGTKPIVTIEPGVKMHFKKGGVFQVIPSSGTQPERAALVAVGTADKPIVFTSNEATPAAGDWLGIWYGQIPSADNKLEHVRVEFAGGTSASGPDSCKDNDELHNDAAIRLFGVPPSAFIKNTTIVSSLTNGIDRSYRSDTSIDFLSSNTFTNVTLCFQTLNKASNGSCPNENAVPCPRTN